MSKPRILSLGDSGQDVADIQNRLSALGYSVASTGIFNSGTKTALVLYQRSVGLDPTGTVDFRTRLSIFRAIKRVEDVPSNKVDLVDSKARKKASSTSVSRRVLVVIAGSPDKVHIMATEAMKSLGDGIGLVVSTTGDSHIDYDVSFFKAVKASQESLWLAAIDEAKIQSERFDWVLFCDKSGLVSARIDQLERSLLTTSAQASFGAWFDTGSGRLMPVNRESIYEGLHADFSLVRASSVWQIPRHHEWRGFPSLFLDWSVNRAKYVFVNGTPVFTGQVCVDPEWPDIRDRVIRKSWHTPKISALMVTGKCIERYALSRVAITCFLRQTWPNKELVIVNHGPIRLLDFTDQEGRAQINEVMIDRPESMTLGDLRNLSMDAASGEWLIQWDDDDWHHPLRMETQFLHSRPGAINTLEWQVRCSLGGEVAFYDKMPGGQHMSVFYENGSNHRYEKLNVREDTTFFNSFSRRDVIENEPLNTPEDPMLYVRLFHDMNIWDKRHILGGSSQDRNWNSRNVELLQHHVGLFESVIKEFGSSVDEFKAELSISGHK